jgi:hypothetical protein
MQTFRDTYGEANCVGLDSVINTDYMSSEHSDSGEMEPHVFAQFRQENGGGTDGLEIHRLMWRSNRVRCPVMSYIEACLTETGSIS